MLFEAEIIKDVSYDPYYKIRFSYENDVIDVQRGFAEVIRKSPAPVIQYDAKTDAFLNPDEKVKLNLELMNVVVDYLLSRGTSRTIKGKVVLSIA